MPFYPDVRNIKNMGDLKKLYKTQNRSFPSDFETTNYNCSNYNTRLQKILSLKDSRIIFNSNPRNFIDFILIYLYCMTENERRQNIIQLNNLLFFAFNPEYSSDKAYYWNKKYGWEI